MLTGDVFIPPRQSGHTHFGSLRNETAGGYELPAGMS